MIRVESIWMDALAAELPRHDVLHADATPVAMLKPGAGKTHGAYLWSYCTIQFNPVQGVVFDFADSRGGQHAPASTSTSCSRSKASLAA